MTTQSGKVAGINMEARPSAQSTDGAEEMRPRLIIEADYNPQLATQPQEMVARVVAIANSLKQANICLLVNYPTLQICGIDVLTYIPPCGLKVVADFRFSGSVQELQTLARLIRPMNLGAVTIQCSVGTVALKAFVDELRDESKGRVPNTKVFGITIPVGADYSEVLSVESVYNCSRHKEVQQLAGYAVATGLDGVIASSADDISLIRRAFGPKIWIVATGIRPVCVSSDDVSKGGIAEFGITPAQALGAGAHTLVVNSQILTGTRKVPPGHAEIKSVLWEMGA